MYVLKGIEDTVHATQFEELPNTNFLSPTDKLEFDAMVADLRNPDRKFKRNKRMTSLENAMLTIKKFVTNGNQNEWSRALAAGAFWIDNYVGINTSQLSSILNKGKSSINGTLSLMGYIPTNMKSEGLNVLLNAIPILRDRGTQQRRWSVRKMTAISPSPPLFKLIPETIPIQQPNTPQTDVFQMKEMFTFDAPSPEHDPFCLISDSWLDDGYDL